MATEVRVKVDRHGNINFGDVFSRNSKILVLFSNDNSGRLCLREAKDVNQKKMRKCKFVLYTDNDCRASLPRGLFKKLKNPREITLKKEGKDYFVPWGRLVE